MRTPKVALITGGTRGIGHAIAKRLLADGHRVAVTYARDDDSARAAEAAFLDIAEATDHRVIRADATSWDETERVVAAVEDELGPIHVLVTNVGAAMRRTPLDTPPEYWEWMWRINYQSALSYSIVAGRGMVQRGAGVIVNVNAVSGLRAFRNRAAHCTAKAATLMLSRCLALEWAEHGVRVNSIAPGVVATELVDELMDAGILSSEAAMRATPVRRFAEPTEVAGLVAYLVRDEASYVNGETIVIDGGWLTHAGDF